MKPAAKVTIAMSVATIIWLFNVFFISDISFLSLLSLLFLLSLSSLIFSELEVLILTL